MSKEFVNFMDNLRKEDKLDDKIDYLSEIIEKIMKITLNIPDIVDEQIREIQLQINEIKRKIDLVEDKQEKAIKIKDKGVDKRIEEEFSKVSDNIDLIINVMNIFLPDNIKICPKCHSVYTYPAKYCINPEHNEKIILKDFELKSEIDDLKDRKNRLMDLIKEIGKI
ncbi:MAG: hypothetical protein ACTSPY_04305 [Candidatus Helarchaeota archaeon]